jgi:hypothetical protein
MIFNCEPAEVVVVGFGNGHHGAQAGGQAPKVDDDSTSLGLIDIQISK